MRSKETRIELAQCELLRPARGFTLIEMLVALALLGVLSILMTQSMRLGLFSWMRIDAVQSEADRQTLAVGFVRRTINTAAPLTAKTTQDGDVFFVGTASQVSFLSPAPSFMGDPNLVRYRFDLDTLDQGEGSRLTVTVEPLLGSSPPDLKLQTTALFESATKLAFSYFGQTADQSTTAWQSSWDTPYALPRLVRLQSADAKQDGQATIDHVFRLALEANSTCVIDAISHYCRGRNKL